MKSKTHNMKKAFVFDFDDTLAFTDAHIVVHGQDCEWHKLTPDEFNRYELQDGEWFDFSEFNDAEYILNGKPTKLVRLASEVYREGHDLFILTARNDSVADAIQDFLSRFGIKATAVHCVGDDGSDISKNKRKVLLTIMEAYDKIYFYDDDQKNVEAAQEIGVKSYKV